MGQVVTSGSPRIPLWVKLAYTAFMAVLVPYYWWAYTPVNFLHFCDVALFVTLAALWLESSLLASMQAIAITLPQLLWQVDFVSYLVSGVHFPIDFTDYMFQSKNPLFVRGLSFFHFWLPILLLWLVWRLGYDRRALLAQIVLGSVVLVLSYALTPPPPFPNDGPGNVNKIYGPKNEQQTLMDPLLWLGLLMIANPLLNYLPTHGLFCLLFRRREGAPQTGLSQK